MKPKDLADIRKRWSLTQEEMALLMEVSNKLTISHWETGFRSPGGIIKKLYRMLDQLPEPEAKRLLKQLNAFSSRGQSDD